MQDALTHSAAAPDDAYRHLYLQMPLPCWVYDKQTLAFLADIVWAGREARVVFATDVTEQRAAATETKLLYECLESADDMIVVTQAEADARGDRPMVYVNASVERRTGYARAELRGRDPRMLQGPGTDPATRKRIRDALAQ